MSQAGTINTSGGGGSGSPIQTITGNTGTPVVPTANNVNIIGANGITTSGSGSTLTISNTQVAPSYVNVVGPTTYVVTATDYFISCDSTLGVITINMPNAPTTYDQFIIKDRTGTANTNNIIITTVGGVVTIDGLTTYTFTNNYESIETLFNGSSYEVF